MKKFIAAIMLCLIASAFASCASEKENVDNSSQTVVYTAVLTEGYSSTAKGAAILSSGEVEILSSSKIYGYPEITSDGGYAVYRHTQKNAETGEYEKALFVKSPEQDELALMVETLSYKLDANENYVLTSTKDGLFYIDLSSPTPVALGEYKLVAGQPYTTSFNDKTAAFIDTDGNLYYAELDTASVTLADSNVEHIARVSRNALYYTKSDGFYCYKNGLSQLLEASYELTGSDYVITCGAKRYYIAPNGTLTDISNASGRYYAFSGSEKYLVSYSQSGAWTYELSADGAKELSAVSGKFSDAEIYNDGTTVLGSLQSNTFGIIENGEYKQLADSYASSGNTDYHDGVLYFITIDDKNVMKYTLGKKTELVKENVNSNTFNNLKATPSGCYYITDRDENDCGTLWQDGKNEPVLEGVAYLK